MRRRAIRIVVLVLLLALGAGAAVETSGVDRRLQALDAEYRDLANRIERVHAAVTFIAAAQHAYLGSGQPDEQSLNRVSVLIEQIAGDTAAIRMRTRAANSPSHVQAFADGLAGLINADVQARVELSEGRALAAADVIFRESRDSVAVMDAKLREIRYAEAAHVETQRSVLAERARIVIGSVGAAWALGLIVLAPLPRQKSVAMPPVETGKVFDLAEAPVPKPASSSPAPAIDLAATADLCTALSRLTDAASLPGLLERAAGLLDGRGLIVWMGAGEELFAAAAHGYDAATLARVGPIARTANNATATAWRDGAVRIVRGERGGAGAIVVPMFGADGCMGVMAVEVLHGRETDQATAAVASLIAAQLATVLSAWPAPSSRAADRRSATPDPGSDRHAAAS